MEDENRNTIKDKYVQVQIGQNNIQTHITDNDGKIVLPFTATTEETVTITADYKCYQDYGNKTTKNITVGILNTNLTINPINPTKYQETLTITGTLKDTNNQPITVNITITINNQENTITTDTNGTYTHTTIAKTIGTNNITINYQGNNKYNQTTANTTFTVLKA